MAALGCRPGQGAWDCQGRSFPVQGAQACWPAWGESGAAAVPAPHGQILTNEVVYK
jgi:hypothetical protein